MNDEHGRVEPHAISWAEPDLENARPTWAGPAPDARDEQPAATPGPAPAAPVRTGGMSQAWESWTSAAPVAAAAPASSTSPEGAEAEPSQPVPAPAAEPESAAGEIAPEPVAATAPETGAGQGHGFSTAPPQHETASQDQAPRLGATPLSEHDDDPHHGYDQSFMDEPVAAPPVEPAPVEAAPHEPASHEAASEAPAEVSPVEHDASAAPAAPVEQAAPVAAQPAPPVEEPVHASAPPQVVGQNEEIPEDALTIGRSRSNVIVLDDMLVSRRHVVITADEEGLLLRDLGSRNGTYVNGERVEHSHLDEGDRIGIGASTFEVRDGWLVSI